jgi:ATP-dependent Lon protease
MFITTSNWADPIPHVLRDRMEFIHLPGYTDLEKLEIAKRHLIPKQLENHGLTKSQLKIADSAIKIIIDGYTREAGLRNLERSIAAVTRKIARKVATGNTKKHTVEASIIPKLLGPPKFTREVLSRHGLIGVVPALAYTSVGGEILFVEATNMPGKNMLTLTGHLGNVMKESAQAALSFIRSNAEALSLSAATFENREIHIHVPAGATPKDGPSAGITMAVALASLLTKTPVKSCLAMTGEITLRGELLPIGGLKMKLLTAARAGVKIVILPEENRKDIVEIAPEIRKKLKFKFFSEVLPAIRFALDKSAKAKETKKTKPTTKATKATKTKKTTKKKARA